MIRKFRLTPKHLLLGIILIGAMLRFYQLGNGNLFCDEIFTGMIANMGINQLVSELIKDVHPPLFFILQGAWQQLFGFSEVAIRSFTAVLGVTSIWLTYRLALYLFGQPVGLMSAGLTAISSFSIHYSQFARMYMLLLCLSLYSIWLFLRLADRKITKTTWPYIWLALVNAGLLYTHYYGLLTLGFEVIWLLLSIVYRRSAIKPAIWPLCISLASAFVAFLPWVGVIMKQQSLRPISWLPIPGIGEGITELFGNGYLAIILLPLVCLPLLRLNRLPEARSVKLLFLLLGCITIPPFLVSWLVYPVVQMRYLVVASATVYILAAYGLTQLRSSTLRLSVGIWAVILSLYAITTYYQRPDYADWRQASKLIDQIANPNDLIAFHSGFGLNYGYAYYTKRKDLLTVPFPYESQGVTLPVTTQNVLELTPYLADPRRDKVIQVWYAARDPDQLMNQHIKKHGFTVRTVSRLRGITVIEYSRPKILSEP